MSVWRGPSVGPPSRVGAAGTIGLPAENELVVLLAPPHRSEAAEARCRSLLGNELSWPDVLTQAEDHDVLPLVARNLEGFGLAGVPAPIVAELGAARRANAARNALLARELTRVLDALGKVGIPVLPLKGIALAESLYGDPTLRVSSDLDILVPRAKVRLAFDGLEAMDYRAEFTDRFFTDLVLRHDIERGFARWSHGLEYLLDVHWGIAWQGQRDRLAMEDLWASAHRAVFRGAEVYALSPEWQLLFLAVHAARHRWGALKWLVDIHEACVAGGIDWEVVEDKARRFGWEETVRITLRVCHILLDTPLPSEFSRDGLPPWVKLLPAAPMAPAPWQDALLPLRLLRRLPEQVRHLARVMLVPTLAERRLVRLPSRLGLLYYPLRPVRLAGKWAWYAVRLGTERLLKGL